MNKRQPERISSHSLTSAAGCRVDFVPQPIRLMTLSGQATQNRIALIGFGTRHHYLPENPYPDDLFHLHF
jgi:hypothetical protein